MRKNKKSSCRELKLAVGAQPDSSYNVDAIRESVKFSIPEIAETSKIVHTCCRKGPSRRVHSVALLHYGDWCVDVLHAMHQKGHEICNNDAMEPQFDAWKKLMTATNCGCFRRIRKSK